jgi:hypothetical protein
LGKSGRDILREIDASLFLGGPVCKIRVHLLPAGLKICAKQPA